TGAAGIQILDELAIDIHARGAGGKRLRFAHAHDHGKRVLLVPAHGQVHDHAIGVNEANTGADAGESCRRALLNLHLQPIGQEAHDRRRFHPRNPLQLFLALGERNKKSVAANVAAHHFHYLGAADVVVAGKPNVVTGINGETPGVGPVLHGNAGNYGDQDEESSYNRGPFQAVGGFSGEGPSTDRDTLLRAQKRRFLLGFQVNQAGIVQGGGNVLRTGRELQVVLGRWNVSTRHQPYSVVVENRRSNYSCFGSNLRQVFFHRRSNSSPLINADERGPILGNQV